MLIEHNAQAMEEKVVVETWMHLCHRMSILHHLALHAHVHRAMLTPTSHWKRKNDVDEIGQEMKTCICELCHVVFQYDVMNKWNNLDSGKKDRVISQIKDEYKPTRGSEELPIRWIKDHMVDVMKNWRGYVMRRA